ncbi:MAG: hypothetical protein ACLP4R_15495 [Solirubrobacteraceae bacterium]
MSVYSWVSRATAWCDDWNVESQDPVDSVAQHGGSLHVRGPGSRRCAAAEREANHESRGGGDRNGGGAGQDDLPRTGEDPQMPRGADREPPYRAYESHGSRAPHCLLSGTGSSIVGADPILARCLQRIVQPAGALAPEIFGTRRGVRGGEAWGSDFLGRPLGLLLLVSPAERDQLVVRADPIPEPNDVLGRVLTALFGLRYFPLHPVADPLQVFLLLAGPGCPD